jgi:hypothetical protein
MEMFIYCGLYELWLSIVTVRKKEQGSRVDKLIPLVTEVRNCCSRYKSLLDEFVTNINMNFDKLGTHLSTHLQQHGRPVIIPSPQSESFLHAQLLSSLESPLLSLSYLTDTLLEVLESIANKHTPIASSESISLSPVNIPQLLQETLDCLSVSADKKGVEFVITPSSDSLITSTYTADKTCLRFLFFLVSFLIFGDEALTWSRFFIGRYPRARIMLSYLYL